MEDLWRAQADAGAGKIQLGVHSSGRLHVPGFGQRRVSQRNIHRGLNPSLSFLGIYFDPAQVPPAEADSTNFCTAATGIKSNCAFPFFMRSSVASCCVFHESGAD